jgi:hypothetical protein
MMTARDVPSDSRNIPSTISFFETLATGNFVDAGFATGPNDGIFDALTACFADEDRVVRDGLLFADFALPLRPTI